MHKVVFIDRDGTINPDPNGYISSPKQFELFPFCAQAIRIFNNLNYKVVVVTNQSGIARGYYDFSQLEKIHDKMLTLLRNEGAYIDDILVSPYHPQGVIEPYNVVHEDRKPSTGLLKQYFKSKNFFTSKSYVIGDKDSDMKLANNFHLKSILVLTGYGKKTFNERAKLSIFPNYVVDNLLTAAKLLQKIDYI